MKIEESIHVTFDESKKGTERLDEIDDEDFTISYSEEELVPIFAQDPIMNDSPVPIDDHIPEEILEDDSEVSHEEINEDSSPYDDEDDETSGDVLESHRPRFKHRNSHPQELIISDISKGIQTRFSVAKGLSDFCAFNAFLSQLEPKKIDETLKEVG